MSRTQLVGIIALWSLSLSACGTSEDGTADGAPDSEPTPAPTTGIPVSAPQGPIDEALAAAGERLFTEKGCAACHYVGGGRLVGPDLAGVTERRDFEWIYHMVTNPDSMLMEDPAAQELLGEYATPMVNMAVAPDEVVAIYEYLRAAPSGN